MLLLCSFTLSSCNCLRDRFGPVPMDLIAALLLLGVLVFDTVSHLCLKAASGRLVHHGGLEYWHLLLTAPVLWVGIGSFFILFLVWVGFLSRMPLGQGVMLGSITIIGVCWAAGCCSV